MCGPEAWFDTLREEYRLRVFKIQSIQLSFCYKNNIGFYNMLHVST
jgi:hypothetical protein